MKKILSGIWKQAKDSLVIRDLFDMGFETLYEAAKYVIGSEDEQYSFRRNRELIDISYKFRFFKYKEKTYIIKVNNTDEIPIEYFNAYRLKETLDDKAIDVIKIVCPVIIRSEETGRIGLLQEDYGYTLYENIDECRKMFSVIEVFKIYQVLINCGVEWSGFLPRNLFYKDNIWYAIDFEDIFFHENEDWAIRDLTIFKLLLGWGQIFEISQVKSTLDEVLKGRKTAFAPLDSFERALAELIDSKSDSNTRNIGFDLTYKSELPVHRFRATSQFLNSMDLGHLMEDIFDNDYLSVWYTVSTAIIKDEYGEEYYSSFLNCLEHVLIVWLSEATIPFCDKKALKKIQEIVVSLLICYSLHQGDDICCMLIDTKSLEDIYTVLVTANIGIAAVKQYQDLQSTCGWSAAVSRSKSVHIFLNVVYAQLRKSFPSLLKYDLLLRGSCAQGFMTTKSDVDFEISSLEKPNGYIAAEKLLSAILGIFGIECEGSLDRPDEIDMISSNGLTRDFHEWCELIVPGSKKQNKGWNNSLYEVSSIWQFYSEYESQKHNISTKYMFFQIRAIIERFAIKYSINQSFVTEILLELQEHVPINKVAIIEDTLKQCLDCYESNEIDFNTIICVKRNIDYLYRTLGIVNHN